MSKNQEFENWRAQAEHAAAMRRSTHEIRQAARRLRAAANEKGAQTREIATQSAPLAKSQTNRRRGANWRPMK